MANDTKEVKGDFDSFLSDTTINKPSGKKRFGKVSSISKGIIVLDVDGNGEEVLESKYPKAKIGDTIEIK